MFRRELVTSFLVFSFIFVCVPSASCMSSPPTIYVSGDGSGDYNCAGKSDQVQINQALQFVANNSEYTTVHLEGPFTYVIDDSILIGDNTILEGDSTAVIKLANHAGWPPMKSLIQLMGDRGNNITVRGFEVNGNYEGNREIMLGRGYHNVMYFTYCNDVKVYNMYMHDGNGDGLRVNKGSNIQFYNNTVYKLGHDGLFVLRSENVEAWNNRITCRTNSALRVWNTNHVKFHDNVIDSFHHWSAGGPGIQIEKGPDSSNQSAIVNDVEVYNNTIFNSFGPGIWMPDYDASTSIGDQGKSVHIHHNIFYSTGTNPSITSIGGIVANGFNGTLIENNLFDSCYGAAISLTSPPEYIPTGGLFEITVRNNIVVNTQEGIVDPNGTGYAAINNFPQIYDLVLQNNSLYNNVRGDYKNCTSTTDIYVNPLFADQNNHDYRLLSAAGRWDGQKWVKDKVSSPCIDAGYPYSDYSNEPEPNGNRRNIGPDGNTIYASKSGSYGSIPIYSETSAVWKWSDRIKKYIERLWDDAGNDVETVPNYTIVSPAPAPAQSASPIIDETQITTSVSYKESPSIYGERIVWQDFRNGYPGNASWDIYMYDIAASKEIRITIDESWQENPEIFGDRIVWEDGRNGNQDIYMYNISTSTETRITNDESDNTHPAIYGDKIVWEERLDSGKHDIYMYSISARKEIRITNGESDNIHPAIYGDRIVWERHDGENHDICMYTISTSKVTQITKNGKAYNPAIYDDRIVWEDHRLADEYDLSSSDIFKYDLSTHKDTQISTSGRAHNSAIYGDRIVWYDFRNGNDDLYMYNITTSSEIQITTNMSEQEFPTIYGDRIVWQDYRNVPYKPDIYMGSISYPSVAAF
jgi:beta propeller repeat protein